MKNIIFILFLFNFQSLALAQNDSIRRKFLEARKRYYTENCNKDSVRAIAESKLVNKYFMNVAAPYGDEFLAANELELILKKKILFGEAFGWEVMSVVIVENAMKSITQEKLKRNLAKLS